MLFKNSQDEIEFNDIVIPQNVTKVGIKLSGGVDSAIVCYMLAKYCKESRPDVTIYPITFIGDGKAYNMIFAMEIVKKISELLEFHNFGEHYNINVRTDSAESNSVDQLSLLDQLYKDNKIEIHFTGVTSTPSVIEYPELNCKGRPPDREQTSERKLQYGISGSPNLRSPLVNNDKKGVAEYYEILGVLDSLFPLTRSCESYTDNFESHCGECWFCKERFWAFGRYE